MIRVTSGPLTGQYVYYGHVAESLVHVDQRVAAGQPIAVMGHTGDAADLGHGHIEIGFSDASGIRSTTTARSSERPPAPRCVTCCTCPALPQLWKGAPDAQAS